MTTIFSRYHFLSGMIFTTFSWGTLAATPISLPDDPETRLYWFDDGDKVEPLLVSNNKGYRIQCGNNGNKKMVERLGFSFWQLPTKGIEDWEIYKSNYHDRQ